MIREPGIVLQKSDAEEHLRGLNRYSSLYENIENEFQQSQKKLFNQRGENLLTSYQGYGQDAYTLGSDFINVMSAAYDSSLKSKGATLSPSIGSGLREKIASDLDKETAAAYDSYMMNYFAKRLALDQGQRSNLSTIENNYQNNLNTLIQNAQSATSAVDKMVSTEAGYWSGLASAPKEYLNYLVENGQIDSTNPNFKQYFDYEGNLLNAEEWDAMMYKDGQPTEAMLNFYNQILYGTDGISGVDSFDKWLLNKNPELYEYYRTNGAEVFNTIGVSDKPWVAQSNEKAPDTTFANSKDFGTVKRYNISGDEGNSVNYFEDLTFSGLNIESINNNENENFTAEYTDAEGTKRKYKMKVSKDSTASDEIGKTIYKATGGNIQDGKLYTYGTNVYLASVVDGKTTFRLVTFRDEDSKNAFWKTLMNEDELNKKYSEPIGPTIDWRNQKPTAPNL